MAEKSNDNIYSIITNIIKNDKVSHALLFEVDECDTSLPFIKDVAKMILCKEKEKEFHNLNCNKCNICELINTNNYPDLLVIETDGNWIKKQQLMDLQEDFNNKSMLDNKRIYVIKEAEKLNTSSSNSLLKFLEEPGDDIVAILLTKNRYLLLDTILSRCQIFSLKGADFDLSCDFLDKVEGFIDYLTRKKNLFVFYKDIYENILPDKNIAKKVLSEVEKYFMYYLINQSSNNDIDSRTFHNLSKMTVNEMILYVKIIEKEKQKLEFNVNYKIWLDSFFSKIIGEVYDRSSNC